MASPKQTWAKDITSVGAGSSSVSTTGGEPTSIRTPQNKVSDPVWGIQYPVGGTPADPEIPVTKGE